MKARTSVAAAALSLAVAGCSSGGTNQTPSTKALGSGTTQQSLGSQPLSSAQPMLVSTTSVRRSAESIAAVPAGSIVFHDNFENDAVGGLPAAWTMAGGIWSVCQPAGASHEYCQSSAAGGISTPSFSGEGALGDYHVDATVVRLTPGGPGGAAVLGRMQDATHFYELELRADVAGSGKEFWYIWKYDGKTWTEIAGGPFTANSTPYYYLRLDMQGSALNAYVAYDYSKTNFVALGGGTDNSNTAGGVGLRSWGVGTVRFDNVNVTSDNSGPAPSPSPTEAPVADSRLVVPSGFYAEAIAKVSGSRELAADASGNLVVGTTGTSVYLVTNADGVGGGGTPTAILNLSEGPAEGVALGNGSVYVGTNTSIWKASYANGTVGSVSRIASIRTGPVAPHSDGDVHRSTSVAVGANQLFISVGSSCNACTEVDPTRATVLSTSLSGGATTLVAKRIRNAVALTINSATGTLWAGGAGQDNLPSGHPYEYFDPVTSHTLPVDYGWPVCEENNNPYGSGANCSGIVEPRVEFPAYQTLIGAVFYPSNQTGKYVFPQQYRGGPFVSMHGSWHTNASGTPYSPPRVSFVPMSGDQPATPVNWNNPGVQWSDFLSGFQTASGSRWDRPTGITVGPQGSLFVAGDDGTIYRIRPGTRP